MEPWKGVILKEGILGGGKMSSKWAGKRGDYGQCKLCKFVFG